MVAKLTAENFAAHFAGGRLSNQPSHAKERRFYGDPANSVKFESEKRGGSMDGQIGTKQVEQILRHEIENWVRWGRKKDWMPASFRCPLGFLYKSTDVHETSYKSQPCDALEAVKLERIIVSLPQRHRQAFVMYQLDKAESRGVVRIVTGREEKARLLGVHVRQYHNIVAQAMNMILREWQKIIARKD